MPAQPSKKDWQDYQSLLAEYVNNVNDYVANYVDGGENPHAPLPPKPPAFDGFQGE